MPSEFGETFRLWHLGRTKQGHALCLHLFKHRVEPVTNGVRQSLVVWFGVNHLDD